MKLQMIGDTIRFLESTLAVVGPALSASLAVTRSNEMLGLGLTSGEIAETTLQQGNIAGLESAFRQQRRKGSREALGRVLLEFGDEAKEAAVQSFKDALQGSAATNK